jgi:hypothetical protein
LQVVKIEFNVNLAPDRFQLAQPPNSELIRVESGGDSKSPARETPQESHPPGMQR